MQNTNSPKRSVRLNNKRLARLDTKKDANTDIPSVHADFNGLNIQFTNKTNDINLLIESHINSQVIQVK